jgi:hypothetical protein
VVQPPCGVCWNSAARHSCSSDSPPQPRPPSTHLLHPNPHSCTPSFLTNPWLLGAGMDSLMWRQINCRGRTVFFENWENWIKEIVSKDPALEVYKVSYNTSVGKADEWFNGGRWPLDVPSHVSDDCYDVILVDAPQGFAPDMPGAGGGVARRRWPGLGLWCGGLAAQQGLWRLLQAAIRAGMWRVEGKGVICPAASSVWPLVGGSGTRF